eukprot:55582-Alexandrium_andersonii.AAC.1
MSASLVGSEMCIRDRSPFGTGTSGRATPPDTGGGPATGPPGLATAIWGDGGGEAGTACALTGAALG